MINDETKRKLRELGLDDLIGALEMQDHNLALYTSMPFDERLNLAIDTLYQSKNNNRSRRLIKGARFPFHDADIYSGSFVKTTIFDFLMNHILPYNKYNTLLFLK